MRHEEIILIGAKPFSDSQRFEHIMNIISKHDLHIMLEVALRQCFTRGEIDISENYEDNIVTARSLPCAQKQILTDALRIAFLDTEGPKPEIYN